MTRVLRGATSERLVCTGKRQGWGRSTATVLVVPFPCESTEAAPAAAATSRHEKVWADDVQGRKNKRKRGRAVRWSRLTSLFDVSCTECTVAAHTRLCRRGS